MIHECNVFCHSEESDMMELLGKDSLTVGKWLPFAFDLTLVDAIKMSTDDSEIMVHKCSTVFLSSGDTYIVDTKFRDLVELWKQVNFSLFDSSDDDNDLEL